jgi:hypothetical protein
VNAWRFTFDVNDRLLMQAFSWYVSGGLNNFTVRVEVFKAGAGRTRR